MEMHFNCLRLALRGDLMNLTSFENTMAWHAHITKKNTSHQSLKPHLNYVENGANLIKASSISWCHFPLTLTIYIIFKTTVYYHMTNSLKNRGIFRLLIIRYIVLNNDKWLSNNLGEQIKGCTMLWAWQNIHLTMIEEAWKELQGVNTNPVQ